MTTPSPLPDILGLRPGETVDAWCRRTFGPPADDVTTPSGDLAPTSTPRLRRARALLERSIPAAHVWCRFDAPELPERLHGPSIEAANAAYRKRRICLMGASRAGKTSLAVAMLRAWVETYERPALFVAAHHLAVARIQHPAGRGEAPRVEQAMRAPLLLLDDLGSERDLPTNAIPDVIFARHAQDLPTWVTTGFTRDPLVARYGAGVVNRLFERVRVIAVAPKRTSVRKSTTAQE